MSDDTNKHLDRFMLLQSFRLHTTTVGLAALALIRHGEYELAEDLQKNFRPIAEWFNAGFKAMQERDE